MIPYFCQKQEKMLQNLSSAAVMIDGLIVNDPFICNQLFTLCMLGNFACFLWSADFLKKVLHFHFKVNTVKPV